MPVRVTISPLSSTPIGLYLDAARSRILDELKRFIRFPTVSAQPKYASEMRSCAGWLADHLQRIGLEQVQIVPTQRHPILYAEWCHAPGRPTVLIYGHYDVQPVDPLNEWHSPPFEPTVRNNNLYARGACDDKGQLFAHVKALEAYLQNEGTLPVNVKCLFEGEEEIGSPHLTPFLQQHRRTLDADVAVMLDTRMLGPEQPAITYALRGTLNLELEVRGPQHDLHSGLFGGVVHNPLHALCEMIAQLHTTDGRIAIPDFYECVRQWSEEERETMADTGPSDSRILQETGVARSWGVGGYSLYERATIRPVLAVTGISGGYGGPGVKAVIPARAVAKLNFRLVPDQEPRDIEQLVRHHIARITPPSVRSTLRTFAAARPALLNRRHPAMRAAIAAYRQGFGAVPVFVRSGGTIPVVNTLQTVLGIPTILMGFALPDDRIHAPNEKFYLPNLYRGIATCIAFLRELGAKAR